MELLLVLVIEQFTLEAEVFSKASPASVTELLHRLPQTADAALNLHKGTRDLFSDFYQDCPHLGDIVPPECVILMVIVTEPASVQLAATARGLQIKSSKNVSTKLLSRGYQQRVRCTVYNTVLSIKTTFSKTKLSKFKLTPPLFLSVPCVL